MKPYRLTGGARIGRLNASYPLANLTVQQDQLELRVAAIGNFVFAPTDIISIEKYQVLPFLGRGIKINHQVEQYQSKIIIWTFKNPEQVIKAIEQTGFLQGLPTRDPTLKAKIVAKQAQGSFPFKTYVLVVVGLAWVAAWTIDVLRFTSAPEQNSPLGSSVQTLVALLLLCTLLAFSSPAFRQKILKPGKDLDDIKYFCYFILVIGTGLLLFSLLQNA